MACHYGLVLLVLEASEGALRQAGLHRSADEFDRLRRRFLRSRREEQGPIGQLQIPCYSILVRATQRRIPGLHRQKRPGRP